MHRDAQSIAPSYNRLFKMISKRCIIHSKVSTTADWELATFYKKKKTKKTKKTKKSQSPRGALSFPFTSTTKVTSLGRSDTSRHLLNLSTVKQNTCY